MRIGLIGFAGFMAGAGFRGYRILKEHGELDAGWNGGWPMVRDVNIACAVVVVTALWLASRITPE